MGKLGWLGVLGLVGFVLLLVARDPWLAIVAGLLVSAGMAVALVNTGGQLSQSLDGPFSGTMLDPGLGFQAVWLIAALLGLVRGRAVLLLREARQPR